MEIENKREVIASMVDNSYNMIECHYDEVKGFLEENKNKRFLLFKDHYDSDGKTKKGIEMETELIVLNNSV